MKYAMAFTVTRDGEVRHADWYDYSNVYNLPEVPEWWWKYLEGFWEDELYWCLVEHEEE